MEQLARFAELVRQHDLTYQYSDDYSVWLAGQQSYDAIVAMMRALGPAHAVRALKSGGNSRTDDSFASPSQGV